MICAAVCTQILYINPNIISLVAAGLIVTIFFIKKVSKTVKMMGAILGIALFVTSTIFYDPCGSGCLSSGTRFNITALPENTVFNFIIQNN